MNIVHFSIMSLVLVVFAFIISGIIFYYFKNIYLKIFTVIIQIVIFALNMKSIIQLSSQKDNEPYIGLIVAHGLLLFILFWVILGSLANVFRISDTDTDKNINKNNS
jgi:hypothetical protein